MRRQIRIENKHINWLRSKSVYKYKEVYKIVSQGSIRQKKGWYCFCGLWLNYLGMKGHKENNLWYSGNLTKTGVLLYWYLCNCTTRFCIKEILSGLIFAVMPIPFEEKVQKQYLLSILYKLLMSSSNLVQFGILISFGLTLKI